MKAPEHREKLEAEIWRVLGKAATKADVDNLLVWADIYAMASINDELDKRAARLAAAEASAAEHYQRLAGELIP